MTTVSQTLCDYVSQEIIPCYDAFDAAHGRDHALTVIEQSLRLAQYYDVDADMVYCIAAYHDVGLCEGREMHHIVSGRMLRADQRLRQWFDEAQIETMAQAVEDHRASAGHEPRSLYGRIVAESDRDINPEKIILRTVQYGLSHYPELDKEGHWRRALQHLHEKYAEGGYLQLWIPESDNAHQLRLLRELIADESRLRQVFERCFADCKDYY